jgi:hypothetical protein
MFLLYKGKGDPLIPNSYRAIALLDGFLKVYERLLFFVCLRGPGSEILSLLRNLVFGLVRAH